MKTNIILHHSKATEKEAFLNTVNSIFAQTYQDFELTVICDDDTEKISKVIDAVNSNAIKVNIVEHADEKLAVQFNLAIQKSKADACLYLDNRAQEVVLKKSTLEICSLAVKNNKNTGLIYSDYEMLENGEVKEIRLLKHHVGRVRDNQDYGKVFFFSREAVNEVGGMTDSVQFNALYDLRLKISEIFELLHISNRYAGSLYQVVVQVKAHNVFDYLLSS